MEKLDLEDFEMAVMNSGIEGEFYGEYFGRSSHEGYAVTLDSEAQMVKLGAALGDSVCADLAQYTPHIDSLGRGLIVSWPKHLFND